ncbi:MAG: hypothetical protein JXA89_02595, partial [Anaerolineae bacterium]|nr:hypothetical protein [Anaerolineae bacterium]
HHIVVVVDGGPKIITCIVDGKLNDGGAFRQFGWGRFSPNLRDVNGAEQLSIAPYVEGLRVYNRALHTQRRLAIFEQGWGNRHLKDRLVTVWGLSRIATLGTLLLLGHWDVGQPSSPYPRPGPGNKAR